MFNFIKDNLKKIYSQFSTKVHALFGRTTIDEATLKELEAILLAADTGIVTTKVIIERLKKALAQGTLQKGDDLRVALEQLLLQLLPPSPDREQAQLFLLVGINGSGKTTLAGKLAYRLNQQGKQVLFAAADTFRAAAPEQLSIWAERAGTQIVMGKQGQDPASVVFTACELYKKEGYNALIVDTAGRLQTKTNLMKELEKIKKIIERQLPNVKLCTLLTIDAMLGQNSLEQARVFHESTKLDGIVLTKMDGTGKGGIVFSIAQELNVPIAYVSFGEGIENLKPFNAQEYVTNLIKS